MARPFRDEDDENKPLTNQQILFAEAYYYATGRARSFTSAAKQAGVNVASAHTIGYRWAKMPNIRRFWRELDEVEGEQRRSMFLQAIKRLEELAEDPEVEVAAKLAINQEIIKSTQHAFEDYPGKEEAKNKDESTEATIGQVLYSVNNLLGGLSNGTSIPETDSNNS